MSALPAFRRSRGETGDELIGSTSSEPVPLDPVPAPLRPLVAAGMAKDPSAGRAMRPPLSPSCDGRGGGYGADWEERGRSHLGEAALLLAALWPSGPPPAVQGTTVEHVSLFRRASQPAGTAAAAAPAARRHGPGGYRGRRRHRGGGGGRRAGHQRAAAARRLR